MVKTASTHINIMLYLQLRPQWQHWNFVPQWSKPNTTRTSSYSMDYLKYTYDEGNQLTGVKDYYNNTTSNSMGGFKDGNTTPVDYAYDTNGNMTVDKNKNITSIHYNHLNLPTKIV